MINQLLKPLKHKVTKSKLASSSAWALGNVLAVQGMRLLSNLILTRMLVPEYFGLMALVQSAIVIVTMLTDIGLNGALYNSKRLDDRAFMQTAWTLQLLKGAVVALLLLAASHPISVAYGEPELFLLLVVASLASLFDSGRSTAMILADIKLNQRPRFISESLALAVTIVVMIITAYLTRSYWALMVGHVSGVILRLVFSYTLFPGPHIVGFRLEKAALKEIFGYGKWIFLSSALFVVQTQADIMIMGFWMPMEELGLYSIATVFASLIVILTGAISGRVLHPYYNKLIADSTAVALTAKIRRIRNKLHLFFLSIALFIAAFGQLIIELLYDDRYLSAGWMLQLLAFGRIGNVLSATLTPYMLAKGDSYGVMAYQFFLSVLLLVGLYLGGTYSGTVGLILAYTLIPILSHFILLYMVRKHEIRLVSNDGLTILFCFTFTLTALYVSGSMFWDMVGLSEYVAEFTSSLF